MRRSLALIAAGALAGALAGCGASSDGSGGGGGSPVAAASTEVSFDAADTTTYGTLEVPAHASGAQLAAALLIPGSGPADRDGNVAGSITADTLKVVAGILAQQGIATLRFDKYYTGRTGAGTLSPDGSDEPVQADLDQAQDAYDFLARQPSVDTSRLLVVGHSEGGMIALHIATTDAKPPAGLALLEPQDERALDLVRVQTDEQIQALAQAGELTTAQARSNAETTARAIAAFRAGRPVDTTGMDPQVVGLFAPIIESAPAKRYVVTWDQVDPVGLAARVRSGTRVLVTDGTRDVNVPPSTIGPLVRALTTAGTTGPGLSVVQGTDHLMHLAAQPDSQAVLAPAEVTALQGWASAYASH